jgi:hypothetical protein
MDSRSLPSATGSDHAAIDGLMDAFFQAFGNLGGVRPPLDRLRELCLPGAVIVKQGGAEPEVFGLEAFIAPRERLLTDGTLVDFQEEEVEAQTTVWGGIAQRLSLYRKSGVLAGRPFQARGMKTTQLVRTSGGWRISALAWDDERDGLQLPERLPED